MRLGRVAAACALVVGVTACSADSPGEAEPTPSAPPSSAAAPPAPSAPSGPGDDRDLDVDSLVVPPAAAAMPASWQERFVIGYGAGRELLGTSPGGDSGSLDIGPEYGAPGPDGSWWFLDAAKQRVAHYDAEGQYLDEVKIPRRVLVNGQYFQWQLPHVLADGMLVAARQAPTRLLRVRNGTVDEVAVVGPFAPTYSDSTLLYGFTGGANQAVVDPTDGSKEPTEVFRTPSGTPFTVAMDFDNGNLLVELPEADISKVLPVSTLSGARAHVGLQVRAGADDSLHLFLVGAGEDDESVQLVGATVVSPSGQVAEVEPLTNPFSESDPGSPAQLAMAPGSSTPMLVYVLTDGVHVYERTG